MSYILEALKKSQAERQLGELPSIHAPQVQLHDGAASASARRTPVWLALGGVAVTVAAALLLWQPWQADAAAPAAPAAPAVVPAMLAQAVPAPLPLAAPPAAVAPAPVAASVPPAAIAAPVHHARPVAEPKQETPGQAVSPPVAAPAPAVPPTPAAEESVPGMRDLPEPIQRQIPAIAIGGYIYSKNPADRLLLIDKVLRHEGEELAPGLVLEKLQPKAAIFSFKGYRYRVPY